jgi:hypothetical protein
MSSRLPVCPTASLPVIVKPLDEKPKFDWADKFHFIFNLLQVKIKKAWVDETKLFSPISLSRVPVAGVEPSNLRILS